MSRLTINSIVLSVVLTLSLVAAGVTFVAPAAAQEDPVQEDDVSVDGSTVTITTSGANSISVSNLPSNATVSNISDGGSYDDEEGSILYADFGSGLPDTVSFRLTPPESAAVGDTVQFTVDGEPVSLNVVGTFDFDIELQKDATVTAGDNTTITAYPSNNAENSVSDALLELTVDTNGDGEFTEGEVVTSQTLDFAPNESRASGLTYTNVELAVGDYEYQAQISKNGQTTTSYTTGTLTVSEASDQPPEETPSVIEENTVAAGGSTITINTEGVNSISVSDLPTDVSISAVSDGGVYNADEGSILYTDFGNGLPETVTFTLTPGDSYADGDTLDFTVGGTSVTLQVTETSVPEDIKGDVTAAQYNAVVGDNGELNAPNLSSAINSWATTGSVNGAEIGAPELSALINYWANN